MFTGIIQETGTIQSVTVHDNGISCTIETKPDFLSSVELGESISVNGVCSTVTELSINSFCVDYLPETCNKTSFSDSCKDMVVNLEKSLTLSTKLSGHMVSGHIDETCQIMAIHETHPFWEFEFKYNQKNAAYLIEKGSVCLDGISLTVNKLTQSTFSCFIIPHTIEATNLKHKQKDDWINIEYDMIGKYILRKEQVKNDRDD